MSDGELRELLDFGVPAAREAGEITLGYFRRKFETRLKGKDNFVTQADIEAEEFLRRRIAEKFPDDAIIGEDPRNIDWKATARRGALISRNRQVEKGQQLAVLLDAGRLMAETIGAYSRLEHAKSQRKKKSLICSEG